ncbi:hypothetical protein VTO73DRAFT_12523 [Trametes versicolor]
MAVLWRELPSLLPLYKVLIPDDVLETLTACWTNLPDSAPLQSQINSVHSPGSERWARFMHYAAYIRTVLRIELDGFETELFRLLAGQPPPEDVSDFITGLTVLRQLRELKLHCSLDPHHLRELVFGLPHLVGLNASIDGFSDARRGQLDRIFAPSLRRLKCSGAWDDIVRLPFALKCPALDELRLALHRPSPSTFLAALCQCVRGICGQAFAPRLRLLSIFATGAAQAPKRRSIADILAPLAALESLEDLALEVVDRGEGSMLLVPLGSDNIMRTVAAALRRARRVSLVVRHAQSHTMHSRWTRSYEYQDPNTPTLRSLVHFATMCPRLTSLALVPVFVPPLMLMIAGKGMPTCSAPNLRELHLHAEEEVTRTNAPRSLAVYLDKLFPNLEISAYTYHHSVLPASVAVTAMDHDGINITRRKRIVHCGDEATAT